MIDWLVSAAQPLVDAIHDRSRWVDGALLVSAGLMFAGKHWLGAQPICGRDGNVRRTTAEALKCARMERVLAPAAYTAFAAFVALCVGDSHVWEAEGGTMWPGWAEAAILMVVLATIVWSAFATVAALFGKSFWPLWAKKRESDEFVLWKQEAFVEYAKTTPYPGTLAGEQPAVPSVP